MLSKSCRLTPGLGILHVLSAGLGRQLNTKPIVLLAFLHVTLRYLPADHREVSQHFLVGLILLETSLEALLCGGQIVLLPVHVAECIPSLSLGGHQLEGL